MKLKWKAGLLAGGLLTATALSSVATQYVAGQLGYHPALGSPVVAGLYQPAAWFMWQHETWASGVRSVFLWPDLGAGGIALALVVGSIGAVFRNGARKPKPFPDVHGSAEWATADDIRKMGLLGNSEGVYVGSWEDPETKSIHYMRDKSGAHIGGIAPTRSGKGLGWVLPNLLSWPESVFVYDPKGELWQLTAGWRKSIGQNVLRWQPGDPNSSCSFNFLDAVRIGTEYETADAQNIATMLIDHNGKGFDIHWDRAAFGFLSGFLLHCLHKARDVGLVASLPTATALLSSPRLDPLTLCKGMAASRHGAAINAAGVDQINRSDRERDAVLSTVKTYLSLFLDPIVVRNTEQSTFRMQDLMDGARPTSLYLAVPGTDSLRLMPLTRLFISMMLNHMIGKALAFDDQQQPIATHRHKLLLEMDEFPDLQRMNTFERALAIMAGSGITSFMLMQDREQLLKAYGQHQTIMANVHIVGAYAPNEGKTADWLSHELGNKTVNLEQFSASGKRGTRLANLSHSFHAIPRPLMTSDEIRRLPGAVKEGTRVVKAGQMLILVTGQRPILGRQILYFEDPTFLARSRILPPERSDDIELSRRFVTV